MEDPGISGGTPVCNVSPSDIAANVNNLLERVQKLENTVAQILSGNVEATQLSDLSSDLGWIFNVTYLGEDGWTQTPSGTLIPPTGWTGLSNQIDGETGLTLYSGGSVPGGNIPTAHRYSTNASSTLTSGSNRVLQINGSISASSDMSIDDDSIFDTAGTDDLGNTNVWEILNDGVYDIEVYFSVSDVSPITSGSVRVYIAERRVATYRSLAYYYVKSTNGGWIDDTVSFNFTRKLYAGRYIVPIVYNFTDGSISFDNFEMMGSLERFA